jgi:hypothetical protein
LGVKREAKREWHFRAVFPGRISYTRRSRKGRNGISGLAKLRKKIRQVHMDNLSIGQETALTLLEARLKFLRDDDNALRLFYSY